MQELILPPYSPDLNPIEMLWSKLKSFLRKWKVRDVKILRNAVKAAVVRTVTCGTVGLKNQIIVRIFANRYRKLNQPVEFTIGATKHYWFSLYAHLRQDNQTVRLIKPLQSDALRGLFIYETKRFNHLSRSLTKSKSGSVSTNLFKSNTTPKILSASFKASSSLSLIIKQYIEQLKSFESSIAIFDAEIEEIYDTFDCHFHTITGIGKTLAAIILSEIDGRKFESVPKLVAFAGLYPKNRQSGESISSKGRLSKRGSPHLPTLFGLPLLSLKDPTIERKISEGKSHLNVMGHHKLISTIFAVIRDNKPCELAQLSS